MGGGKMRAMPLLCEIQIMGKDVVLGVGWIMAAIRSEQWPYF